MTSQCSSYQQCYQKQQLLDCHSSSALRRDNTINLLISRNINLLTSINMDLSKFNTQNLITKVRAKPRYRNHSNRKPYQKPKELSVVDPQWEVLDPKPDIHALYKEFNVKFFKGKLPEVDLKWSNRVTKGSGITKRTTTGKYIVRLYKPLLDLRPRSTTVEILLHEMIHVYQLTNGRKDWEHGPTFHYHKRRINKLTGANITAYPDYEEEYDLLKRHWWQCNGPCGEIERRTMNRPPSTKAHKRKCGGKFIKISDPENSPSKKRRKV